MQKLLITGASGLLGWSLCHAARQQWQVFGTVHTKRIAIANCTLLQANLCDRPAVTDLFSHVQPDAVIHAAALSKPNACQTNPDQSFAINVQASLHIAERCAEADIPCVFISSEQVFDGTQAPYTETDPVSPINVYGEHKVLAETGMRDRHLQTTICRMPLLYGAVPHADSFLQPWLKTLKTGGTLKLFVDEIRPPLSAADAAAGILIALQHQPPFLHLAGPEHLSRLEMGQMLAEIAHLPLNLLEPCHQADVVMAAPRPLNASLDCTLAQSLGFSPRSFRQELQRLLNTFPKEHQHIHQEY